MRTQPNKQNSTPIVSGSTFKKHQVFIGDASGSMSGPKWDSLVEGYLSIVKTVQKENFTTMSTIIFPNYEHKMFEAVNYVTAVLPHYANGSSTPLFRTMWEVLSKVKQKLTLEDKFLVSIVTDGGDNVPFGNLPGLKELVTYLISKGVTITFIGTENDTQSMINLFNLDKSNTLVHQNTGDSVQEAFATNTRALGMYSKSVDLGEDTTTNYFTKVVNPQWPHQNQQ